MSGQTCKLSYKLGQSDTSSKQGPSKYHKSKCIGKVGVSYLKPSRKKTSGDGCEKKKTATLEGHLVIDLVSSDSKGKLSDWLKQTKRVA